jgi:hypothetical protein
MLVINFGSFYAGILMLKMVLKHHQHSGCLAIGPTARWDGQTTSTNSHLPHASNGHLP